MPSIKCVKCGREITSENVVYLQIPPGIGGCNSCFVDIDANNMVLEG